MDKYAMQQLFKHLPFLDTAEYTDYYLNKSLSRFSHQPPEMFYLRYDLPELNTGITKNLNEQLMENLGFPSIDYALVFKHRLPQPIHIDGHSFVRQSSLNLPLIGYENTKMIFYNLKSKDEPCLHTDAFYFNEDSVEYNCELPGDNNWVLVNTSIPHRIINSDPQNPRITVCFRFKTNPTYEHLSNLIDKHLKC